MTKCRRCAICFARSPRIMQSTISWRMLSLLSASVIFSLGEFSLGTAPTTAVAHDRRKTEAISRLADRWSMPVTAVQGEAVTALPKLSKNIYDIVYVDPPFDFTAYDE